MSSTRNAPKAGDEWPLCTEGVLGVSPSGKHLTCLKCGQVIVVPKANSTVQTPLRKEGAKTA
jgi:ethanolamine utilization protein EutQ (cupin superfamily)